MSFTVEGYRYSQPVFVEWSDGEAIGSWRLIDGLRDAVEAEVRIELLPEGQIVVAAFEPAEVAFATILALLDGMPSAVYGNIPALFADNRHWAKVA